MVLLQCFARNVHFRRSSIAVWDFSAFLRSFALLEGFPSQAELAGMQQSSRSRAGHCLCRPHWAACPTTTFPLAVKFLSPSISQSCKSSPSYLKQKAILAFPNLHRAQFHLQPALVLVIQADIENIFLKEMMKRYVMTWYGSRYKLC